MNGRLDSLPVDLLALGLGDPQPTESAQDRCCTDATVSIRDPDGKLRRVHLRARVWPFDHPNAEAERLSKKKSGSL